MLQRFINTRAIIEKLLTLSFGSSGDESGLTLWTIPALERRADFSMARARLGSSFCWRSASRSCTTSFVARPVQRFHVESTVLPACKIGDKVIRALAFRDDRPCKPQDLLLRAGPASVSVFHIYFPCTLEERAISIYRPFTGGI